MLGSVSGDDYGFLSEATQPWSIKGKIGQGGKFVPTYNLSFFPATSTIGVEANTADASGFGLTIMAGDATLNNRTAGTLTLGSGASRGSGSSTVNVVTYTNTAASGVANTPVIAQTWGNNGKTTTFAGLAVEGNGLPSLRKSPAMSSTQTGAVTVTSLTPPATAGRYRLCGVITTTSSTNTGTVGFTVDYKDSQGTTHTGDVLTVNDGGTIGATGTGASQEFRMLCETISIDTSATAIALKTVVTGTVSYTVAGSIEHVH
jgi:hypothetical protein